MPRHTCHLPGCGRSCPPAWLFCRKHWRMVPRDLQQEVYDTVKRRGSHVDKSWAPWWRAQALAAESVLRTERQMPPETIDRWLKHELEFADVLEGK